MSGDDGSGQSGEGLTDDDYERIKTFSETDPDDRDPAQLIPTGDYGTNGEEPHPSHGLTVQKCITVRRDMSEADTVREVMEDYPDKHTSEIMKHAYGECNHSHGVPATASPQIKTRECRLFRERYAAGSSVSEISSEFYRADNTVTRHIFGRCSHPNVPRPASVSDVDGWECSRIRETYIGNDKVGVEAAATAMGLRVEVAATHLFGYCECEAAVPAAEGVEEW